MTEPNENQSEKPQNKYPDTPPKWIKLFLGANLFMLVAMFLWMISSPSFETAQDIEKMSPERKSLVKRVQSENLPPKDISGTFGKETIYTLNAAKENQWAHFSFSKGTIFYQEILANESLDWDIAFRRAKVLTNGGDTNKNGKGAVVDMKTREFESITMAPIDGYVVDKIATNLTEPKNAFLDGWYKYDFWSHQLTSNQSVYVVKTSDGMYTKFQIVDYYCGEIAACYTFKYMYNGTGSRSFIEEAG